MVVNRSDKKKVDDDSNWKHDKFQGKSNYTCLQINYNIIYHKDTLLYMYILI